MAAIDCAGKNLDLSRPCVMGILNVTPDSFSDGGDFLGPGNALLQARRMVEEGADIIDVGGESTRPGAMAVSEQQELDRVIPIVSAIAAEFHIPVSVDTSKAAVMCEAVAAGAGFINDVMALRAPGAVDAARSAGVPVCLMHMQGEPRSMQQNPSYQDVVSDVRAFLASRIEACVAGGISKDRLLLDPDLFKSGPGRPDRFFDGHRHLVRDIPLLRFCLAALQQAFTVFRFPLAVV